MIKIYHNRDFLEVPGFYWGTKAFPCREQLDLVAFVKTDDLEEAFRLTNHIDRPWQYNPEVTYRNANPRPRSTSCGDVARLADGSWYVCAAVGWEKFNPYWTGAGTYEPEEADMPSIVEPF